jgi:6-phosphogluconolactonase
LKKEIKIFSSPSKLAEKFAEELVAMIKDSSATKGIFTLALSGGSTPKLLFSILGNHYTDSVAWKYVNLFWSDERCVPPDDPESNFGMAKKTFLDKIKIPAKNIHRIKGEKDPSEEVIRYSNEIKGLTGQRSELPVFDLILLGLGEDGHTASIFPGDNKLLFSEKICEISIHPISFQKRITLTAKVINNAENVIFLVTGTNKAEIVSAINESLVPVDYPASYIEPRSGILKWYLDDEAAKMVDKIGRQN